MVPYIDDLKCTRCQIRNKLGLSVQIIRSKNNYFHIYLFECYSLQNTYNLGVGNPVKIAVAASIGGDKAAFYDCSFRGLQDTLCDYVGRHYFQKCWIEGSTDFIFGFGQSMYEVCLIES